MLSFHTILCIWCWNLTSSVYSRHLHQTRFSFNSFFFVCAFDLRLNWINPDEKIVAIVGHGKEIVWIYLAHTVRQRVYFIMINIIIIYIIRCKAVVCMRIEEPNSLPFTRHIHLFFYHILTFVNDLNFVRAVRVWF